MTTVADLLGRFRVHAESYYSTNPAEQRHLALISEAVSQAIDASIPVETFGPKKLQSVRNLMIAGGWKLPLGSEARPWSRTYINKQISRLVAIFRWGVSEEIVPVSVVSALDCVPTLLAGRSAAREGRGEVTDVKDSVVEATLEYLPSDELRDLVMVQKLTAARGGEILAMRPCDLIFCEDMAEYRPESHKKAYIGKKRVIMIGPQALEIICRRMPMGLYERIFPSYSPGSYANAVRKAADKAGVERFHPHRLRHAGCTKVAAEYGIEAASKVAGHSNTKISEVYAHHGLELARNVMRKIG